MKDTQGPGAFVLGWVLRTHHFCFLLAFVFFCFVLFVLFCISLLFHWEGKRNVLIDHQMTLVEGRS